MRPVKLYFALATVLLLHFCRSRLVMTYVSAIDNGYYLVTDFPTDFRRYARHDMPIEFKNRITRNLDPNEPKQDLRVMIVPFVAITIAIVWLSILTF